MQDRATNPVYLIVAWPGQHGAPAAYHGLARPPSGQVIPANDGPADRIWQAEIESVPDDASADSLCGVVDRQVATRLVRAYRGAGYDFDLIEVHRPADPDHATTLAQRRGFLGFDVSVEDQRSWLPELENIRREVQSGADRQVQWVPVWTLLAEHFIAKLNRFGLLDDFDEAILMRNVVRYIAKCSPDQHEPEDQEVDVYAIVRIHVAS